MRALVALLAIASGVLGCARPPALPAPPTPLFLDAPCDLAPAAHLAWALEGSPRALAEAAPLIPAIALVVPEARFRLFAAAHGVDLRQVDRACVAHYPSGDLAIAKTPLDPVAIERAWNARATRPAPRALVVANPPVVRLAEDGEELFVFDRAALVIARGTPELGRAALAFAEGKLKRAAPALRGRTLAGVADVLGPAPVRFFVPGPFAGEDARGFAGLLAASTAVGVAARPAADWPAIAVRIVLAGAWGDDAPAAARRLSSALDVAAEGPLIKLLGLDHPIVPPEVQARPDALVVDLTIDALAFARGLHAALDADVADILSR